MTKVLIVNCSGAIGSSGQLFDALYLAFAKAGHEAEIMHLEPASSFAGKFARLLPLSRERRAKLRRADVVVLHTSVIFTAWEIVVSRLRGKRVAVIYWDSYPESFNVLNRSKSRLGSFLFGAIERWLLRRCNVLLPPSEDYVPHLHKVFPGIETRVLRMWMFTPVTDRGRPDRGTPPLEIGFAGAVDPIRGLDHAVRRISEATVGPVSFHTYGRTAPYLGLPAAGARVTHVHHGFVSPDAIMERLAAHDFGLVSLHPGFPLPAFPSKTLVYVGAGLPILYVGPELPDYQALLAELGIGTTLAPGVSAELVCEAERLRGAITQAQTRTLEKLELNEAQLDKILQ
ncbi:hypothetical protein ACVDG3_22120 [Meridianimarinicoccus sp. RP-17]|uniref:hypothetical protein n=1 Tax=Meridianimarinicoccus zhengii TaxID=2056810 RepID=UPI000DAD95E2|nr:hypothetical protein [Phycocomes zhengii]